MILEELRQSWKTYRVAAEEEILSEEELLDLLPSNTVPLYQRVLFTATRYVAVYGFLFFCCQSC